MLQQPESSAANCFIEIKADFNLYFSHKGSRPEEFQHQPTEVLTWHSRDGSLLADDRFGTNLS